MIDVVRQCKAAEVPVYVKQIQITKAWDVAAYEPITRVSHNPAEWPEELRVREK